MIFTFGADTKYREYRKNATQEERDAFEHKLIDAIEKDGIKAEATKNSL